MPELHVAADGAFEKPAVGLQQLDDVTVFHSTLNSTVEFFLKLAAFMQVQFYSKRGYYQ